MNAINYIFIGTIETIEGSSTIKFWLGTLFLAFLGSIVWRSQQLWTDSREAGKKIIAAFQPELNSLIVKDCDTAYILTDDALTKHDLAIRNNIQRLLWFQRFRLRKAWNEMSFCGLDKKHDFRSYVNYLDGGSTAVRCKIRPLAIVRIQKIISIVN